jgi:hypothetical protein
MSDKKDIYVSRDPDSQLRTYETVKLEFRPDELVSVRKAIEVAAEELDLPDDWAKKFSIFADGVACTIDKVLGHESMVLLKASLAKDNGAGLS